MIEGISAVTLGIHEMPRAVRFYRALGFEVLHGGEQSSFTSFRAGASYLNLIAQPADRRWSWWGRIIFMLPMLTLFTTVRLQQDISRLLCPATPNGVSAAST
jgi:hypothetical protein